MNSTKRFAWLVALAVVIAFAIAGCTTPAQPEQKPAATIPPTTVQQSTSPTAPTALPKQPTAVQQSTSPAAPVSGLKSVSIKAQDTAWDIKELTIKAGQPVRFSFINGDSEKHNMVGIGDGLNLLMPDAAPGQTVNYDWNTLSTPGTYKVICAYHPDEMKFNLVVQP